MKCIAYLRVSSNGQAESGLGIEAQREACQQWADKNGAEIAYEFTDEGVSGGKAPQKRDGLLAAINALDDADVLLAAKRDRLAREMSYMGMIERLAEKSGAEVISAAGEGTQTDDPMAAFFQSRMTDMFAEYERLQASLRTKAALAAKRARGEKTGGDVPYGKTVDDDGKLHPGEDANIGDRIVDLRDNEGLSYREIARRLEEYGFEPKGKKFYASTVQGIYKREGA